MRKTIKKKLVLVFLAFGFVCLSLNLESKSLSGKASPLWGVGPVANSPGQHGAYFKTRVTILNPTNFSYSIAATLHNGSGRVQTVLIQMGASQYRTWDNFLDEVFAYVGAGVVDLDSAYTPPNGSLSYIFTVAAEVYTESSFGRYKTTLITLPFDSAPIVPDSYLAAYNGGVNVGASQRTNIGAYNPWVDVSISVLALVYSSEGNLVQTITFDLPPESWKQLPISATVTNGFIRWSSTLPVYQYAVEVDNISNDGSLNLAIEYAP